MRRRSWLFPAYRAASKALRPVVPVVLGWRRRLGQEDAQQSRERMGFAALQRPEGRLVWLHAAGTADGLSLLTLVDRLVARGFHVLVSTRTAPSASAIRRRLPAGSFHQTMPLDVPLYVRRFLDHWRPDLVLIAGAELWPNILVESHRYGAPVIFVNARMSDRIYGYCQRTRSFIGHLMRHVDLCLARTERDAERFTSLGAASVQTVGDLALDQPLPPADPLAVSDFASRVGARPIWVAALVDPDEHAVILDVHRRLLPQYPSLVTVIVPRLPRDGEGLAAAAAARNFEVGLRSRSTPLRRLPGLYIADIAGEIGLFYRIGDIVFVGRSLTGVGRSPIEAAKLGCAILHGPRIERFASVYTALDKAQGGVTVTESLMLARVLSLLFDDGAKLRRMQRNASQTMERLCGGTSRVMRAIEPHVVQMLVER